MLAGTLRWKHDILIVEIAKLYEDAVNLIPERDEFILILCPDRSFKFLGRGGDERSTWRVRIRARTRVKPGSFGDGGLVGN